MVIYGHWPYMTIFCSLEVAFIVLREGMQIELIVANGIDWKPGDNVIIADIEYPSNVYCWQRLLDANVDLAIRGDALRISPSYYNDGDEIN